LALAERKYARRATLAGRYAVGPERFEDLYQVACLALVMAIDRFDPERDAGFTTYAVPTIVGEMKRHFRDRTWTVRVPRELQQLAVSVQRANDRMAAELGRAPTLAELARATAAPQERVCDALHAIGARAPLSLDGHPAGRGATLEALGARAGVDDHGYRRTELRVYLHALAAGLSDRQRTILRLRFVDDLTQREIGERVGLSEASVWRAMHGALEHMRASARTAPEPV
jgi:RNA polymerase sigma-B factor